MVKKMYAFLQQKLPSKAHNKVILLKNIFSWFYQKVLITENCHKEKFKEFLHVVFEKIQFKVWAISWYGNGVTIYEDLRKFEVVFLRNYVYKVSEIPRAALRHLCLLIRLRKNVSCILGPMIDHAPLTDSDYLPRIQY